LLVIENGPACKLEGTAHWPAENFGESSIRLGDALVNAGHRRVERHVRQPTLTPPK